MSRSNLPPRPSDYRMPVFMNDVPEDADEEAEEMALRHGVEEPREANPRKAKAKPTPKPAPKPEPEPEPEPAAATGDEPDPEAAD